MTQGDLTRSITVEASGEVADLKDNINQMIANLRETTARNESQDWLNSNLARFSGLMQGQRDLQEVSSLIMSELTPTVNAQHGAFFLPSPDAEDGVTDGELSLVASYGYKKRKNVSNHFKPGESLVGQAALEKTPILITAAAGRLHPDRLGPRRGGAAQHHRHAGPVRGAGARRDRARLVPARSTTCSSASSTS